MYGFKNKKNLTVYKDESLLVVMIAMLDHFHTEPVKLLLTENKLCLELPQRSPLAGGYFL
jgi:hypothetical protein